MEGERIASREVFRDVVTLLSTNMSSVSIEFLNDFFPVKSSPSAFNRVVKFLFLLFFLSFGEPH